MSMIGRRNMLSHNLNRHRPIG